MIYETILNLAYALFLIGIMFSLATDSETRNKFVDYLQRTLSVVFVVVMVVLGVLTYTLSKAYANDKKYSPRTKRTINFIEDRNIDMQQEYHFIKKLKNKKIKIE